MHRGLRYLQLFVLACAAMVVVLLLTSQGEPVCRGPLIYDWDDSDPIQCNTIGDGLKRYALLIVFAAAALTWTEVAAAELIRWIRRRRGH